MSLFSKKYVKVLRTEMQETQKLLYSLKASLSASQDEVKRLNEHLLVESSVLAKEALREKDALLYSYEKTLEKLKAEVKGLKGYKKAYEDESRMSSLLMDKMINSKEVLETYSLDLKV